MVSILCRFVTILYSYRNNIDIGSTVGVFSLFEMNPRGMASFLSKISKSRCVSGVSENAVDIL